MDEVGSSGERTPEFCLTGGVEGLVPKNGQKVDIIGHFGEADVAAPK